MRRTYFAMLLLGATVAAKAHADIIPVTISGTEIIYFEPLQAEYPPYMDPPLITITGTGYYETYFGDLEFDSNVHIPGLGGMVTFTDVPFGHFAGPPYIELTFNYDPNGLSSGRFRFEESDNLGYAGPEGSILGRNHDIAYGTITQTAVTPEPFSVALLGTGLLGVAGVVRRKYAVQGAA